MLIPIPPLLLLLLDGVACRPDDVDVVRISRMGTISFKRCRADLRCRVVGDGGGARVDWWCCLARMRERRLEVLWVGVVGLGLEVGGVESEVAVLVDESWARMAPALRSSRRRWPLARRGDVLEVEVQVFIGARESAEMNVEGEAEVELLSV